MGCGLSRQTWWASGWEGRIWCLRRRGKNTLMPATSVWRSLQRCTHHHPQEKISSETNTRDKIRNTLTSTQRMMKLRVIGEFQSSISPLNQLTVIQFFQIRVRSGQNLDNSLEHIDALGNSSIIIFHLLIWFWASHQVHRIWLPLIFAFIQSGALTFSSHSVIDLTLKSTYFLPNCLNQGDISSKS